MNPKDGGSAFPNVDVGYNSSITGAAALGMSLRDYFAAKALKGVISIDMLVGADTDEECALFILNAATLAYRLADAMLRARDAQSPAEKQAQHLETFGK